MQQVLLVLGEVLRADVLDLRQLIIILLLHLFTMSLRCLIDAADEVFQLVNLV